MNTIRWTLILSLVAAGGYGLHRHERLNESARPGPDTLAAGFAAVQGAAPIDERAEEQKLRERFELYRKLRLQDDVVALYDMVEPEQRTRVDLRTFLSYYGHGMVRFNDIQLESIAFDWQKREAIVTAMTSAELLVEKLPKSFKLSTRRETDEARIEAPNATVWAQHADGQWYFRMDAQIAAGQTGDGRGIQSFMGQADDQGGGVVSEEEKTPR